jgi:hypothetical protein
MIVLGQSRQSKLDLAAGCCTGRRRGGERENDDCHVRYCRRTKEEKRSFGLEPAELNRKEI